MTKNSRRPGTGVRSYNKSDLPRLRWTPELHHQFVQAVDCLGGKYSKFRLLFSLAKKISEELSCMRRYTAPVRKEDGENSL
ncbi:hypothetical protein QUC31_003975 [Theobroma cacao]